MSGFPKLIRGQPNKISVIMFGQRITIDRAWYDKVKWLANCSELAFLQARAKREAGKLCELDEEYWSKQRCPSA